MLLWDISRIVFIHLVNNDHVLWILEHTIHNEEASREGKKLCCKRGKATCMFIFLGFARHLCRQWPKIKHVWDHVSAYETSMWTMVTSQHWAQKANHVENYASMVTLNESFTLQDTLQKSVGFVQREIKKKLGLCFPPLLIHTQINSWWLDNQEKVKKVTKIKQTACN
jgi:hypothetical protein